jgi:hypothetical protein
MEEREYPRIMPGVEVFDADGHKIGTVAHVYEPASGTPSVPDAAGGATTAGGGILEVKTGLFGLGKHYFIPFTAVKDVTVGGVFAAASKADLDSRGWDRKPSPVARPGGPDQVVSPNRPAEVARPTGTTAAAPEPRASAAATTPAERAPTSTAPPSGDDAATRTP